MKTRKIFCCPCNKKVKADLISGEVIYYHRPDLYDKYFYMCPNCNNFIGTHASNNAPLGIIAGKELKTARQHLHRLIDPVWQSGKITRSKLYKLISEKVGWKYHTACTRSIEECRNVYKIANQIIKDIK